eukprot:scaffold44725_cov19-Tisochrysis_lutea.AAC.3
MLSTATGSRWGTCAPTSNQQQEGHTKSIKHHHIHAGISPNVGVPSTATGSTWGTPAPSPPSPMGTMPSRTFALGPLSACTQGLSPGMVMAAERGAAEAQVCILVLL